MAKKWTPSLKQLSAYDELLKRQNIARKRILRRRKIAEEEGGGRPLPDLVIPMKARRHRDVTKYKFDSYKEYREKMKALQNLYGGKSSPEYQFYNEKYRKNILGLIKEWIGKYIGFTENPKGYFGKYSNEQIFTLSQVGNDFEKFLIMYNNLISMFTGEFMAMYDTGYIPRLKYIYNAMNGEKLSEIDEFIDMFSEWRRQIREGNRITTAFSKRSKRVQNQFKNYQKDISRKEK